MKKRKGFSYFCVLILYTWVASCLSQTPPPLGCYKIDKGNPSFLISAGDYDPEALTVHACLSACSGQGFTYASLMGRFCLCSDTNYPDGNVQADDTNCASPCTGDASEKCGSSDYSMVYDISNVPAAVQLTKDEVSITYMVGVAKSAPVLKTGDYLEMEFDYGDGGSFKLIQDEPYTYGIPGEYMVTATAQNLKGKSSDAVVVTAEMELDRAEMTCPVGVARQTLFTCHLEVYEGYDIDATFDIGEGTVTRTDNLGSPTFSSPGICAQSDAYLLTLQTDAPSDAAWVIPEAEFTNQGRVIAFEAFVTDVGDGNLEFLILRPTCSGSDTWCPTSNTCEASCDWHLLGNGDPVAFTTCSASDLFCPFGGECVTSGDPYTCPASTSRMATLSTDSPLVDYTVVDVVTRTVTAGYNWLKLDDLDTDELPEVIPGDVLGCRWTATGARVGYEMFAEGDNPVEFAYLAPTTAVGSVLPIADGGTGEVKRHHVRAIASTPVVDTFQHAFDAYGNFRIEASLTNIVTETPLKPFGIVGVFSPISGLTVSVDKSLITFGESVTIMVRVASGSPVNYTIVWGDGDTEWMLREATSFDQPDSKTHTYSTIAGTMTIDVTATNVLSTVSEQTTVTAERPIKRDAYYVTSNSPQHHPCFPCSTPATIVFTVTKLSDPTGTSPMMSISSGTRGNTTDIRLDVFMDSGTQDVEHTFRFPGAYHIYYRIYNQISAEDFYFGKVFIQVAIRGFRPKSAYVPVQAGQLYPGRGEDNDLFPVESPVYFTFEVENGTGITVTFDDYGDGSSAGDAVTCDPISECRHAHKYTTAGTYVVSVTASNYINSETSSITITLEESCTGIAVEDTSIGTPAGQEKTFKVDIDSIGTDSCLVVNYKDDGTDLEFYGEKTTCQNHSSYDVALWSGTIPTSTFELTHTYSEDGSYNLKLTCFNRVSEVVRDFPFGVTGLDCTVPYLSIRDHHPEKAFPGNFLKSKPVLLEVLTELNCEVITNVKRWKLESIDPETGSVISGHYLDDPAADNIPDVSKTTIRLEPHWLPFGLYRFIFEMTIDSSSTENVVLTNSISEYVEIAPAPLIIRCLAGQTTSIVVGYNDTLDLNPEQFSTDPNIAADADQGFDEATFKFYCKRFYEDYPQDDNMDLLDTPIIIPEIGATIDEDKGGCYSTGAGRLNHTMGSLQLPTIGMQINMTHEISVIVQKGELVGRAKLLFTVKEGEYPLPVIRCSSGTLYVTDYGSIVFNPTAPLRLQVTCSKGCNSRMTLEWSIEASDGKTRYDLDGWTQHVTVLPNLSSMVQFKGMDTRHLWVGQQVFAILPNATSYEVTVLMTNEAGYTGKSHLLMEPNLPPSGGSCWIDIDSIVVGEKLSVCCQGWEDDHGIEKFKFYVKRSDFYIPINLPIVGYSGDCALVRPPAGSAGIDYRMKLMVDIYDKLGALTEYDISEIEVQANGTLDVNNPNVVEQIQREIALLLAEGNSRDINTKLQTLCSQLNDIRELEDLQLEAIASEDDPEALATALIVRDGEMELRAYMRKQIIDLMCNYLNLDTMRDVQLGANSLSVCTSKTNEISQQTLACILDMITTLITKTDEYASSADQETIVAVFDTIVDNIGNAQEATHYLSQNPLTMNDKIEIQGGDYYTLKELIEEHGGHGGAAAITTTWETTTALIDEELRDEKTILTRRIANGLEKQRPRAQKINLRNMSPGERPHYYKSNTITSACAKGKPNNILDLIPDLDENGGAILPDAAKLFAGSNLSDDDDIDQESSSYRKNPRNYDTSSEALSEDTEVQNIEFSRNGKKLPIENLEVPVVLKIARPKAKIPEFHEFNPGNNTDAVTGMSCHSFLIDYERMAITLDFEPFDVSIPYEVYVMFGEFPTLSNYDEVISLNEDGEFWDETLGYYSFFLSDDYVDNNTGSYFLCIRELTTFPGLEVDYYNKTNNFTGPYSMRLTLSGCRFWDNNDHGDQAWVPRGLEVDPRTDHRFTFCRSYHLSSFASAWIVPPTPLDFNYIFANAGFAQNLTIYITTIVVYVLFFFIMIWARRKDKKDVVLLGVTPLPDNNPKDKYYYEIVVCTGQRKEAGTESKVSFIMSGDQDETEVRSLEDNMRPILKRSSQDRFLLATPRPLGTLNYMRLWHDNSGVGKKQSWYLQYIAVRDIQTRERYYFIANNWFSLVEGDGEVDRLIPVAGKEQMQSFDHVFYGHTRKNLNDGHIWFSIFARPAGSRFTRCQRAACCMMLLWLEMLVNIMWYKVVPPAPASNALSVGPFSLSPAQVSIGVQSAIIVFPISLLVVQLFRKARPRKKRTSRLEEAKKEQIKQIRLGRDRSKAYEKSEAVSASAIDIEEKSDYQNSSPRTESSFMTDPNFIPDPEADLERPVVVNTTFDQPPQKSKKKKAAKTCPWWTVIFAWITVILVTAAATTFTIFYGIQFGNETTAEWLASFIVTTITGILFTQPIKVIAMAIFIALVIKTPNSDEDEDMEADEEEFELGKDEEWLHRISDAPVRRKIAYIPPDPLRIERIREKRMKEIAMYSIIREIILYIIFLWVLMMISYGNQDAYAYVMKEQYSNTLIARDGRQAFDKIVTIEQYWDWVSSGLLPNLYAGSWYNGEDPEDLENFFGDRNAFIVGYPVMRQVRIKPDLCKVHDQLTDIIFECNVGYSMSNEDEDSYEAGWVPTNATDGLREEYTYTSWQDLDGYPYFGKHAVYIGGGYVVKMDDPDALPAKMQQLFEEKWIDRYTRAVFVEFSTYNAQVNLFAVVNLVVEFLPSGGGFPYLRVDVIRLLTYYEGFALVQVCCEAMFFVFIVFFIVKEIRLILKQKRQYPKVFWNLAEWIIIGFSIGLIIVYFYRFYTTKSLISDLKKNGGRGYVKLQYVAYWNELLGYMIGWVVFMATLKFIKLLRFNRRMGVLSSTIRLATNDLIYFGIFFAIVFFAFSIGFFLILGREVYNYSDFVYTMESLITAILGKFNFKELVEADRILGPIFFFFYMGTIAFILINMFLTIITEAFQVVKHDVDKQSNDYEMVEFMMGRLKAFIGIQQAATTLNPKEHEQEAKKKAVKDEMDVFTDKVDQLLNHIAKAYFNQENFDDIIKTMGRGKPPSKPKQITPLTA